MISPLGPAGPRRVGLLGPGSLADARGRVLRGRAARVAPLGTADNAALSAVAGASRPLQRGLEDRSAVASSCRPRALARDQRSQGPRLAGCPRSARHSVNRYVSSRRLLAAARTRRGPAVPRSLLEQLSSSCGVSRPVQRGSAASTGAAPQHGPRHPGRARPLALSSELHREISIKLSFFSSRSALDLNRSRWISVERSYSPPLSFSCYHQGLVGTHGRLGGSN